MLNEASKLLLLGDTDVRIELRFWLRAGRGKLTYEEALTMRLRSCETRDTAERDAEPFERFDRTVRRIAKIDRTALVGYGQDLVDG
jgi:hypothetical protein